MLKKIFFLFILFSGLPVFGQEDITINEIWSEYKFYPEYPHALKFMNDGESFTELDNNTISRYSLKTGEFIEDIYTPSITIEDIGFNGKIDDYNFSSNEQFLLIKSETERIYRHSTRAKFFIIDLEKDIILPVAQSKKIRYATFSPDEKKIAFVSDNNLFVESINDEEISIITKDGKQNEIINGATDWVYEEEFSFSQGFQWSPDSKYIAYYRFDEREVPEFIMTMYHDDTYPEYVSFKYPKVGENNSIITIFIHNLEKEKSVEVSLDKSQEYYIPRIKWTNLPNKLCVFYMNRHQNDLQLLLADSDSGNTEPLLHETNKYYINIDDDLTFLKNKTEFIWTSEKDGFNHLYLYGMDGKLKKQITTGKKEVLEFYGIDEESETLYYKSVGNTPMLQDICSIKLSGKRKETLIGNKGCNSAEFSAGLKYFINNHSTINSPPKHEVYKNNGKKIRTLVDNKLISKRQKQKSVANIDFFDIELADTKLNGWILKPTDFNPNKKYPLFMYLYGGPGSQVVLDRWMGQNYWWFQLLSQKGYIIACIDNRGTGGRGEEFKKQTYMKLGELETKDQIAAAVKLGSLDYIDKDRIGIFGWSYGGYMSSLCLLKGNDVFKAAIAVAPVTNWKWYDSIYTERFMRTETENPTGYKNNSPVYFADKLKGNYLIIHGIGDDNVHFQNTSEMINQLIKAKKSFDSEIFPNRTHGIYGDGARVTLYNKMTDFILEKL